MSTHEENIQKEFEKSEGLSDKKVTNLGSVDVKRTAGGLKPDDPEVKRMNEIAGHVKLNLDLLPSRGKFYREDFEIYLRAARVGEIRDFSTLEEDNIRDVDNKLNEILASCSRIMYGKQRGSYKDILEEDRIYLILSIRELTFKTGESKLMMPVTEKKCQSAGCKTQESVELKTSNLQFNEVEDVVEKYYDHENKCYTVQTKSYGEITLAPPTMGVMRAITNWIRKREQENKPWDKSSLNILPYIQREWRSFTDKEIFSAITEFQGWDATKYSLIYRLIEKIKVGVKPEFVYPCKTCGEEVTVPLTFPGGIKSLFVISDISSELL